MPNGGMDNCGHCGHFCETNEFCQLRRVPIDVSHWTTCRNFRASWKGNPRPDEKPSGPLYSIVCEVVGGGGRYARLPYLDGCRPDTRVPEKRPYGYCKNDTIVVLVDSAGNRHEFGSVAEYLKFYESADRAS